MSRYCNDGSICNRECGVYFCKNAQDAVSDNICTEAEKQINSMSDERDELIELLMGAISDYEMSCKNPTYRETYMRIIAIAKPVIMEEARVLAVEAIEAQDTHCFGYHLDIRDTIKAINKALTGE